MPGTNDGIGFSVNRGPGTLVYPIKYATGFVLFCCDLMYLLELPDSKVHGANMGPIWDRQDPGGPNVGPMNFAIWEGMYLSAFLRGALPLYLHRCQWLSGSLNLLRTKFERFAYFLGDQRCLWYIILAEFTPCPTVIRWNGIRRHIGGT